MLPAKYRCFLTENIGLPKAKTAKIVCTYDQMQIFVSPISEVFCQSCTLGFVLLYGLNSFGKYIPFYHSIVQNSVISKTLFQLEK